jgi:hypothetical protein
MQNSLPEYDFLDTPLFFALTDVDGNIFKDAQRIFELRSMYYNFDNTIGSMNTIPLEIDYKCLDNYDKYWPDYKGAFLVKKEFACITPNSTNIKGRKVYKVHVGGIFFGADVKNTFKFEIQIPRNFGLFKQNS